MTCPIGDTSGAGSHSLHYQPNSVAVAARQVDRLRYSVSAFDPGSAIDAALSALELIGVESQQIVVVDAATAFGVLVSGAHANSSSVLPADILASEAVMIVRCDSVVQQQRTARILLTYGNSRVLLHDCA